MANEKEDYLHIFYNRVKRCITKLESFRDYLYKCRSDENFIDVDWHASIISEIQEAVNLIVKYNSLTIINFVKVKCLNTRDLNFEVLEEVVLDINLILRELKDVEAYLSLYLKPNLTENERNKIGSLNEELENLQTIGCDQIISNNLKEALNEAESKHNLACGIISARIIIGLIEKVHGKTDEEKLQTLINMEVINRDEKSKATTKFFLDAAKSARNAISHRMDLFPLASDSISLLSYAFRMARLVSQYLKKKEKEVNDE